jgi:hypothetical protein
VLRCLVCCLRGRVARRTLPSAAESSEKFGTEQAPQGLKSVCENSVLEGHEFSHTLFRPCGLLFELSHRL